MSQVKNLKIGNVSYTITDANTLPALSAAQRATLLSDGTYLGKTIETGKVFETITGTFETFTDTITGATLSWSSGSLPTSAEWRGLCYGGGKYVLIAKSTDTCYISTDASTWTSSTLPESADWQSIAYGNGKFVAVAPFKYAYSTDGVTWQGGTFDAGSPSIIFADGTFYVAGYDTSSTSTSIIVKSTDGINWSKSTIGTSSAIPTGIAYGNGVFVVSAGGAYNTTNVWYSSNASSWTLGKLPSSARWYGLCYGNGYFVVFPTNISSGFVAYSTNGKNWSTASGVGHYADASFYGNGTFLCPQYWGHYYSYNVTTWQTTSPGFSQKDVYAGVFDGTRFVIAPSGQSTVYFGTSVATHSYSLTDLNANTLKNTATGTDALTILGTAATETQSTNIGSISQAVGWSTALGYNSRALGSGSTAIGKGTLSANLGSISLGSNANATNNRSIALGYNTSSTAIGAIQLGTGTNSEAGSFKVSLTTDGTTINNYKLLGSTGLIPAARLSETVITAKGVPTEETTATYKGQDYVDTATSQKYTCNDYTGSQNFETIGYPLFEGQDVSNFSSQNYLVIDNPFNSLTTSFEVVTSFTRNADESISSYKCIFEAGDSSAKNFRLSLTNDTNRNVLYRFIDTAGTTVATITGTTATTAGVKYWSKVTYDTTNGYKAYISTDGLNWTADGSDASVTLMSTAAGVLDIGQNYGHNAWNFFNGTLHLEDWYIKVDGNTVWTPYDKANNWKQIATLDTHTYQPQENFIKVGSPTITDGVVSGFSSANYIQLPFSFTSTDDSFEIQAKFNLNSIPSTYGQLIGCFDNFKPDIKLNINSSGKLELRCQTNGTSLDTYIVGTTTLSTGTDYLVKVTFDTTNGYNMYLATSGGSYALEGTNSTTTRPYTHIEYPMLVIGYNNYSGYGLPGSIDLNECYVKVDGEYAWKPYNETFYNNFWQYPNPMTTSIRGVCLDQNHIASGFRSNNALVSNYHIADTNSMPYTVYVKAYSDNWKAKSYNIIMFGYTSSMQARFLYTNTSGIPGTYGISKVGTTALENSKWYWFKVDYNDDGTKYTKLYTLEDNDYTLDTLPDTASWTQQLSVSGSLWGNYYTTLSRNDSAYFNGKIDTKGWAVQLYGEYVWKAISDIEPLKKQDTPSITYGYTKPTTTTAGKIGDIYIDKTNNIKYELSFIGESGNYNWIRTFFDETSGALLIGSASTSYYSTHPGNSVAIGKNVYSSYGSVVVGSNSAAGYDSVAIGPSAGASGGSYCIALGASAVCRKIATIQIGRYGYNGKASTCNIGGVDVLSVSGKNINKNYQILDITNGLIPGERLSNTVITGTTAPSTSTIADFIGQSYINTTNNNVYICTAGALTENYNWTNTEYRIAITNGIASGFDGSYRNMNTNGLFTVGSGNYTVVAKFCRDYAQGGYNPILMEYNNNKGLMYESNGKIFIADATGTATGSTVLTLQQWYWIKSEWNGTNNIISIIADNGYTLDTLPTEGWTQQFSRTANMFGSKALTIGRDSGGNYMRGLIDLRNCGVIENDAYSWKAIEITTPYTWTLQGGGSGGSYTAGNGISITNNEIAVTTPTLTNTATGTNSLTILGSSSTPGTGNNSIAIGSNAITGSASSAVAIGTYSAALGGYELALGYGAKVESSAPGGIMLGNGINNESKTLKVALNNTATRATTEATGLFTLLQTDGTIPAARHASLPSDDGSYTLRLTITDGVPTLTWVADANVDATDGTLDL